jgi:hypothetical protein
MRSAKFSPEQVRLINLLARRTGIKGDHQMLLFTETVRPFLDTGLSVVEVERSIQPLIPMIESISKHVELALGEGA